MALTVTNTQWNTASPADFFITVTGGHAPGIVVSPDEGTPQVFVDIGVPYNVKVTTTPEGYVETLSASCSGANPQAAITCQISEREAPFTCDPVLWDPVYRKDDRLKVLSACEVGVVTVTTANLERDGDADILGEPDAPFRRLLGPGNDKEANGKLVIEIPCQGPISQADAMGTCDGFKGARINPPLRVGERIAAAAHWVEDKNHSSQRELHGARVRRLSR